MEDIRVPHLDGLILSRLMQTRKAGTGSRVLVVTDRVKQLQPIINRENEAGISLAMVALEQVRYVFRYI